MIRFFINNFNPNKIKHGSGLIYSGLISIFLGLLVIFVPEILIAFIAFIFISSGLALFGWGINIRRLQNQFQHVKINIEE